MDEFSSLREKAAEEAFRAADFEALFRAYANPDGNHISGNVLVPIEAARWLYGEWRRLVGLIDEHDRAVGSASRNEYDCPGPILD